VVSGFACILCGGTRADPWRTLDSWEIVRCKDCGLAATSPQPDDATLRRIYESGDYLGARSILHPEGWAGRTEEILRLLPNGPVLDIGAGGGHFVAAARQLGVRADGMEPSEAARETARITHGLELLPELPSQGGYSAVTLIHVLEHMRAPLSELTRIHRIMRPGGTLFIEVPHAGSVEMLRPAQARKILDLPVHLFHFTPQTLRKLLATAGFEVETVQLFNADLTETLLTHMVTRPLGKALVKARRLLPGWKFQVVATTPSRYLGSSSDA
jgi:SAM-dependent methyltransferase